MPALAGLLLVWSEPGLVFLVLVIGVTAGPVMVSGVGHVPRAGGLGEAAGGGVLTALPTQRFVVGLGAASAMVMGALDILAVVLALDVLGLGEAGAGHTVSLLGPGGLAGGVLAVSMVGRRLAPVLVAGALLRGVALMILGVEPGWLFLLLLSGSGFSLVDAGIRTLLQRLSAPDVMSRVFWRASIWSVWRQDRFSLRASLHSSARRRRSSSPAGSSRRWCWSDTGC